MSAPRPEVFPDLATLTFRDASYTSQYLTFVSVENETISKAPDQPTTSEEDTLWHHYSDGSFPFTDYGNKYAGSSLFDPGVLSGLTQKQIATALSHPNSRVAQAVDGSANLVIAAICQITGNQPGSVCDTRPSPRSKASSSRYRQRAYTRSATQAMVRFRRSPALFCAAFQLVLSATLSARLTREGEPAVLFACGRQIDLLRSAG